MLTTTNGAAVLLPDEVGALLVEPTLAMSVAAAVSTIVHTGSKSFRIPLVSADPSAQWVNEGQEITPSDPTLSEVVVTPSKVAGLTIISNELAKDSSPEAAGIVGEGLARDIARKIDAAYFGKLLPPAPAGLGSVVGVTAVAAGTAFTNLDAFAEAVAAAEQVGAILTHFVANPADALAMAKLRKSTGSNEPLLSSSATDASTRQLVGVPLLVSPSVVAGTVWGIDGSRSYLVIREDATVEVDASPFFTSDRTAVRAVERVGFAFPHAASVVKITIGP